MTTEEIIEKQVQVEREHKERRIDRYIRKMRGKELMANNYQSNAKIINHFQ